MDERLNKALDFSNYMTTLNNKKRLLREKYFEELVYFINGCQFSVTKELVTFVGFLVDHGNDTDIVLTDDNDIPTKIENLSSFYDDILDVYFTASNNYLVEYEKIKKSRTVEKLVDYEQN